MTEVVVQGDARGFEQFISASGHELIADEPIEAGGNAAGPGPYEFLLAALGSCTSMTIAMYARRKAWPLERVAVYLRHSKVHAKDCEDCDEKPVMLDRIDCEIELVGDLSSEQRARLLEIADRCPVHRTLTSPIEIHTAAR